MGRSAKTAETLRLLERRAGTLGLQALRGEVLVKEPEEERLLFWP